MKTKWEQIFDTPCTIIRPILFYGNMQRELDIPSKLISGELALIIGSFFLKSQTTHLLEKGLARM